MNKIPLTRELEPLLDIDRNVKKFDAYLSSMTPALQVSDMRKFLASCINVDPFLRKRIRGMFPSSQAQIRPTNILCEQNSEEKMLGVHLIHTQHTPHDPSAPIYMLKLPLSDATFEHLTALPCLNFFPFVILFRTDYMKTYESQLQDLSLLGRAPPPDPCKSHHHTILL